MIFNDLKYDDIINIKAKEYPDPSDELWPLVKNNPQFKTWKNISKEKTISNWRDF